MRLNRLELNEFKSHEFRAYSFLRKIIAFVGKNGVGKTNILESIYYLSTFKSIQNLTDQQLMREGASYFRIAAYFDDDKEVIVKYGSRKKRIQILGNEIKRLSDFFGHIPCIMAGPQDIFIFHGGSEERRKLMDITISAYNRGYLEKLNVYHSILEQRNAYLKNTEIPEKELLDIYNKKLISPGNYIFEKRLEFITELIPLVHFWYEKIAGKSEKIQLSYQSHLQKDTFSSLLESNLQKDIILHRTSVGIHKDDLILEMGMGDFKKIASQGQQRTLLYAIRLAQAEIIYKKKQEKVIFLLDDFSQYMDSERVSNTLNLLHSIDFIDQWFLTDTSIEFFSKLDDVEIFHL